MMQHDEHKAVRLADGLLLAGNGLGLALTRARVGLGALAVHGQALRREASSKSIGHVCNRLHSWQQGGLLHHSM